MRILALDVGERRIGLALSDPTGLLASPVDALELDDGEPAPEQAARRASEYEIGEIVVGMPYSMSGERGRQAGRVAAFARELAALVDVPVTTVDERLSTAQAERMLRGQGVETSRERGRLDSAAAAVILQGYLDSRRATPPS